MLLRASLVASVIAFTACSKKDDDQTPGTNGPKIESNGKYDVLKMNKGVEYHTGLLKESDETKGLGVRHVTFTAGCDALPETFDLRPEGNVSPVRDQGQCGSCWAHSETQALESLFKLTGISRAKLSVQELVSNDSSNWGCNGGLMNPNRSYQVNHGQGLDADFPYRAADLPAKSIPVVGKASSWAFVGSPNRAPTIAETKCALYKNRTTPWVTVAASNAWGSFPSSENQTYNRCQNGQTNHAVTIVGWNKQGWIMQNSWGTNWGAAGFGVIPYLSANGSGSMGVCDAFGSEVAFVYGEQPLPPPPPLPPSPPGPGPTPAPPSPCKVPLLKLPAVIAAESDADVFVGVQSQEGVTYEWFKNSVAIAAVTAQIRVNAEATDSIFRIVGKNKCGIAESSVKVKLISATIKK